MSRHAKGLITRRLLVLIALMFWQGGFTFYAAVVVPVGRQVLDPPSLQALVTQQVTNYLNLSGAIALAVLAWDTASGHDPGVRRRNWRWGMWGLMVLALGVLVWLHLRLDQMIDAEGTTQEEMRGMHRLYLWMSTLQWGCGVMYAMLTLSAWQAEDRG